MSIKHFVIGFLLGLTLASVSWAITVSEIWSSVYDSGNTAIRVNEVVSP